MPCPTPPRHFISDYISLQPVAPRSVASSAVPPPSCPPKDEPGRVRAGGNYRLEMMTENPSTHAPQDPVTPQMLYPRGGISVCLDNCQSKRFADLSSHDGKDKYVRGTALYIPVKGRAPASACEHLDGVDPGAGADREARDVLATVDVCEKRR